VVGVLVQQDMIWAADEIERLQAELDKANSARAGLVTFAQMYEEKWKAAQAVVDAARERCWEIISHRRHEAVETAREILRALDGEVKP